MKGGEKVKPVVSIDALPDRVTFHDFGKIII